MIESASPYPVIETHAAGGETPAHTEPPATILRIPAKTDASAVHALIQSCPPLDLNSVYTYLLLSEHFADTCVVAHASGQLNGFASAYIPPNAPDVLFVWQVAVHARARGSKLGLRMLFGLLRRPGLRHIRYLETTVGPDNVASRRMFSQLARQLGASTNESALFEPHLFGTHNHEEERLIRIGPFVANERPGQ